MDNKPQINDFKDSSDYMVALYHWEKENNLPHQRDNKLLCTEGDLLPPHTLGNLSIVRHPNGINILGNEQQTIVAKIDGMSPEEREANAQRIVLAWNCHDEVYNGHLKHLEEIHTALNAAATSDKIGEWELKQLLGAIGENCEKLVRKVNPNYKPKQL